MTSETIDERNEIIINELEKENISLLRQLNDVQTKYEAFSNILKQLNINPDNVKEGQTELKFRERIIPDKLFGEIVEISKSLLNLNAETDQGKNIVITAQDSSAADTTLPSRLLHIFKGKDPNKLFAHEGRELLEAHDKGGENEVGRLLAPYPPKVKADAYTSLCDLLMQKDKKQTASYALKAWAQDPTPLRLKHLAFRTFENDEEVRAFALLFLLPEDIPMSDPEIRMAEMIEEKGWSALQISPEDKKIYDAFMPLFLKGSKGA